MQISTYIGHTVPAGLVKAFDTWDMILVGLYAKLPFAQAPGMRLNAFFAYTVVLATGYTYGQALRTVQNGWSVTAGILPASSGSR